LLPKHKNSDEEDDEEVDTDLETDRLLGHQMLDDGFFDDKSWSDRKQQHRSLLSSKISPKVNQHALPKSNASSSLSRHGLNTLLPTTAAQECCNSSTLTTTAAAPLHQSHSLKTSPSLNSGNMINLIHPSIVTPDRSVNPSPRKLEDLPEQCEQQSIHNSVPETTDLCNLDEEMVDSPGGSSDKSKTDLTNSNDKKKKNKNKEGKSKFRLLLSFCRLTNPFTLLTLKCFQFGKLLVSLATRESFSSFLMKYSFIHSGIHSADRRRPVPSSLLGINSARLRRPTDQIDSNDASRGSRVKDKSFGESL